MKSKAALAEELSKEPEPPKPEPPKPPERRLPGQFDIAKQLVDLIHQTWPQAQQQDWITFYNALGLAKGELRRTWQKRKREQRQPI